MASARPSSSAAGRRVARLCRHVAYSDTSTTTRNTVATTTSGGGAGGGAGAADSALLAAAPTASSYTESEANNVPWLPLPSLADTMARLQEFAGPVCSKADMEDLAAAVREFLADPNAHVLQKHLEELRKARPHHNYMLDFWRHMYLSGRYPIAINVNPWLAFHHLVAGKTQAHTAGRICHSMAKFAHMLHCGTRPKDMERGTPMCDSQIADMWGSTRIPQLGCDTIRWPDLKRRHRHIVVLRKHRFYRLELMDEHGGVYTASQLTPQFQAIMDADATEGSRPEHGLGILTAVDRDTWARNYAEFRDYHKANEAFLEDIITSLFVVCLDSRVPRTRNEIADINLMGGREYPTRPGDKTNMDGMARWYDKALMLIITADSRAVVNLEHAWGDGVAVCRAMMEVAFDVTGMPSPYPPLAAQVSTDICPSPSLIKCVMPPKLPSAILAAARSHAAAADNVDVCLKWCEDFGYAAMKRWGVSPDAFSQMAMQVAVRLAMRGVVGDDEGISTYEPASMRHFIGGRTDTIRVVTDESKEFVRLMLSKDATPQQLRTALDKAAQAHKKRTMRVMSGQGVERHLFALRMVASQKLEPKDVPRLFSCAAYTNMSRNTLSTSTLPTEIMEFGGFGPVEEVGYGGGYFLQRNRFFVGISCNKRKSDGSPTGCSGEAFMEAWLATVRRMRDFCEVTKPARR